jgi:hypothetical protein
MKAGSQWVSHQTKHYQQVVRIRRCTPAKVSFEWVRGPGSHIGERRWMARAQFLGAFEPTN